MSSSTNYVCCHRNRHLIVPLLFLLISSLTQVTFMAAEGRSLSRLLEVDQKGIEEENPFIMSSLIGSRPPRSKRRCRSCPNCKAIQVPVALFSTSYSRGDDISNYKPMSWKCKCGNLIYNP